KSCPAAAKATFVGRTLRRYSPAMATPPRRPARPGRPTTGSTRRAPPPPDDEIPEGEEGEFEEEAPPAKPAVPVTMLVAVGAALLFSILLAYYILGKRGFDLEVENTSETPLSNVI